jgi:hypothetical protein
VNKLKENIVIRCYFQEAQRARAHERSAGARRKIIHVIARVLYMEVHRAPPCFDCFIRPAAPDYLFDDNID